MVPNLRSSLIIRLESVGYSKEKTGCNGVSTRLLKSCALQDDLERMIISVEDAMERLRKHLQDQRSVEERHERAQKKF